MNILQPHDKLYRNSKICATNGVVQCEVDEPFRVLVANFSASEYHLAKNQVVGMLLPHPTAVVQIRVNIADVLGLSEPITHKGESQDAPQQGIALELMSTAAACRTWNVLISEGRNAAAALYAVA